MIDNWPSFIDCIINFCVATFNCNLIVPKFPLMNYEGVEVKCTHQQNYRINDAGRAAVV